MKRLRIESTGKEPIFAMVDDEDYELLNSMTWRVFTSSSGRVYARHSSRKTKLDVLLHRFILKARPRMWVDFIDNNSLNCQKFNLVEKLEGHCLGDNPKSGITWNRRISKWVVRVSFKGIRRYGGVFEDLNMAVAAREGLRTRYGSK